jgi:hypothetical protein
MKDNGGSRLPLWNLGRLWERNRVPRRVRALSKLERDGARGRKLLEHLGSRVWRGMSDSWSRERESFVY